MTTEIIAYREKQSTWVWHKKNDIEWHGNPQNGGSIISGVMMDKIIKYGNVVAVGIKVNGITVDVPHRASIFF